MNEARSRQQVWVIERFTSALIHLRRRVGGRLLVEYYNWLDFPSQYRPATAEEEDEIHTLEGHGTQGVQAQVPPQDPPAPVVEAPEALSDSAPDVPRRSAWERLNDEPSDSDSEP